ncbi:steroid 17-alpha-hydroxylase/17,20 lyase-like [Saccostrea echinata]|uniref:steroid 17-alpha-hydroxylase/17,20 lyase-like n=1 Tax=Saccostrea echinata TaxID=191078 RepID=UPI002A82BFC2|nr:steroid 17-alpha-hydroxylase/17,20 lyase-like [Saccostrea echinata]
MVLFVVISFVLLFLLFCTLLDDLYLIKFKRLPPGPLSLPIIGGLHLLGREPYKSVQNMAAKYGGILSLRLGMQERFVYVVDPELAKQLLSSEYLADRPRLPFFDVLSKEGHGIGSRPYDFTWKLHTRIIYSSISKLIQTQLDNILQNSEEHLFKILEGKKGEPILPETEIRTAVLMTMGRFIFGHEYASADDPKLQLILWLNEETMKGLQPVNLINLIPGLQYISLPFYPNYRNLKKAKERFLNDEFESHKRNFDGHALDIMDMIIKELEEDEHDSMKFRQKQRKEFLLPQNFLMSIFTLIVGGEQTLSSNLLWLLLYTAKHQDCQEKILRELRNNDIVPTDFVQFHNKQKFPYTTAFYKETMRFVSTSYFGIPRTASADIHVNGFTIPKGTTVFPNFWSINHNEKYWSQPHEFQPERFLELKNLHSPNIPGFIIYGYGRRPCIGSQIARACLFSFLCNTVNKFHVSLPPDEEPDMRGHTQLVIEPPKFKLIFQKRS